MLVPAAETLRRTLSFGVCAWLLLAVSAAWAQWPALDDVPAVDKTGGSDVAVVVGIDDYLLLPDVPGATRNAADWELFLRNGVGVREVHTVLNNDATRESMLRFAKVAGRSAGPKGTVWWIFVGHGATSAQHGAMFLGADTQAKADSLTARGAPQKEVLRALESGGAKVVMIVDASFGGLDTTGNPLAPGLQPVVAVPTVIPAESRHLVMTATKATQSARSLESISRPAFSYLMLGALRGWADADDGVVTAAEALFYAQRQLRELGNQQTPELRGDAARALTRGTTERQPKPGVVVAPSAAPQPATSSDLSARQLGYMSNRIEVQGRQLRQGGQVLRGPEFYYAIGRPDLAKKWKNYKPVLLATGIGLLNLRRRRDGGRGWVRSTRRCERRRLDRSDHRWRLVRWDRHNRGLLRNVVRHHWRETPARSLPT